MTYTTTTRTLDDRSTQFIVTGTGVSTDFVAHARTEWPALQTGNIAWVVQKNLDGTKTVTIWRTG